MNESSNHSLTASVIIPAYNVADTIVEALESVDLKTHEGLLIVVVDDMSSDNTVNVVNAWIAQSGMSGRCSLIVQAENSGPAGARNAGIRYAETEWIAFLDADDAWLPFHVERIAEQIDHDSAAVIVCADVLWMGDDDVPTAPPAECRTGIVSLDQFIDGNPVHTSTVFIKKRAVEEAGYFDQQFRGPEDIDLWLRVAERGPILKLHEAHAMYRERAASISMCTDLFLPQVLKVYDKAFGAGGALFEYRACRGRARASRLVSSAWACLEAGRRMKALGLLLRSWLAWPRRIAVEEKHPLWRLSMLARVLFLSTNTNSERST